jgi:putative ABC transport system substrate-binding protein
VFVAVADPIGQGIVANLARPGGNITGFSASVDMALAGKYLEILTQIDPPVARVAVLFNPATAPNAGSTLNSIDEAARSLKLPVQPAPVDTESEIEAVMAEFAREPRGGLVVLASIFTVGHRASIIDLAARYRLPAVYGFPLFATAGGLMAYGVETVDLIRGSADYVDRILKGDRPGDLPVQQPTKFILVINLKTAKALGITIAPSLLAIADEVIE